MTVMPKSHESAVSPTEPTTRLAALVVRRGCSLLVRITSPKRLAMHFVHQADIRQAADSAAAEHRRRILARLPGAEIHHVGATSVPGALTKGDVDLAVRVDPPEFLTSSVELGCLYAVHQPENWTATYASFSDPEAADPPVGVQLVVRESADDLLFVALRDLLRSDPELLAAYNDLKREHEGATHDDYTDAKERFWEPVLARLREPGAHS